MPPDSPPPEDAPPDDTSSSDTPFSSVRDRPKTETSYGIPEPETGLRDWAVVEAAFTDHDVFWASTTRPDGRPHARPVWGVWVDGAFHCGGGERTRWVRNLAHDPRITVHTESGIDVVVLEGVAVRLDEGTADGETLTRIDDAYESKYEIRHGTPVFRIRPERVLAWADFPTDATRWRFDAP